MDIGKEYIPKEDNNKSKGIERKVIISEQKTKEYLKNSPEKFMARMIFEPGYSIRISLGIPMERAYRNSSIKSAIFLETMKTVGYATLLYYIL